MGRRVRAPESAVRLKVTLKGLEPPVWRRLLVENTMILGDLHMAVQAAMGWENGHLHLFMVGRDEIGDPAQLDEVRTRRRSRWVNSRVPGCRKYLKRVGVTSQQAIERHVREHGVRSGRLKVRTVLTIEGHGMEHVVEGEIDLG